MIDDQTNRINFNFNLNRLLFPIFKSNRSPLIQFSKWIFHLMMLLLDGLIIFPFRSHPFHSFNYEIFTNE